MVCKQELLQQLKKQLHQNDMSIYSYEQQVTYELFQEKQKLVDVVADSLGIKRQQLHKRICKKLKQCLRQQNLPKRLVYIYNDRSIIEDYQKDPDLVSFNHISYEIICLLYDTKLLIYTLAPQYDGSYFLNCTIVNPVSSDKQIQIAKINTSFYRIQQQQLESHHSLPSIQSVKSSNNLQSQQKQQKQYSKIYETFQSQKIIADQIQNGQNKLLHSYNQKHQVASSGKLKDMHDYDLKLQKGKSVNFADLSHVKQYDQVSLGKMVDAQEEQLFKQCNPLSKSIHNNSSASHHNNHIGMHQNNHLQNNIVAPTDMMYYYYLQNYNHYPGKSQPYLHYAGHSISPTKSPHKVIQTGNLNIPNLSSSVRSQFPLYSQNCQSTTTPQSNIEPLDIKEGERYAGRLKFFDQGKKYGFIIMDADESDLFVHLDDLQRAGILKEDIKTFRQSEGYMHIRFTFKVMQYFGKYKQSRKAVDLELIPQSLEQKWPQLK